MKQLLKKVLLAGALTAGLVLQLSGSALAATQAERWEASQAGTLYLQNNTNIHGVVDGFGGVTEWATIAVKAAGHDPVTFANGGDSLVEAMLADPMDDTALATDVERRILAIAAAGQNPADFGGVNYSALLATYHQDDQIGDPTLLNDDMFGVMAAAATDDDALKPAAQDALDYFLSYQEADGSFSYTTLDCVYCDSNSNDTAAAIVAMQAAENFGLAHEDLATAKAKAIEYVLSAQKEDGGFAFIPAASDADGSSTAWCLIALNSVGQTVADEAEQARDWLLANQAENGGFSYITSGATDTYTSSHAIIALLGTTWLLDPKPIEAPAEPTPEPPTPTPVTYITISSPQTQNNPNSAPTPTETVLSEQTETPTPQPTKTEEPAPQSQTETPAQNTDKKSNYSEWVLVGLLLVAILWFVLQSKTKKGKE